PREQSLGAHWLISGKSVTASNYCDRQSRGKTGNMDSFNPYLAGFFDGDGSLHFQIVRSNVYRFGFYLRSSLVFYQSTSAAAGLLEIQRRIGGRMRERGSMSDLTITRRQTIRSLLEDMQPYVIFKRAQVDKGLRLLDHLPPPKDPSGFLEVCQEIDEF